MIKSKSTGNFYATARKAFISSTFDAETCKALIGTEMKGTIERRECEPYEYTVKETGEVIELSHQYVYVPEEDVQAFIKADLNTFSSNGILETTV